MEDVDDKMTDDIEMTDESGFMMEELPEEYQDGVKNFKRLLDTLADLNTRTEYPGDWVREHKRHIKIYSYVIPKLKMTKYMEDPKYQALVRKVEENLRLLEEGLKNKQIILDAYGYFVQDLVELMNMYHQMNDLCDLMAGM